MTAIFAPFEEYFRVSSGMNLKAESTTRPYWADLTEEADDKEGRKQDSLRSRHFDFLHFPDCGT